MRTPQRAPSAVTAAGKGEREHLVQLETAGVSLGEPDEGGTTPLLAAVKGGHDEVIDFLITRESALATRQAIKSY